MNKILIMLSFFIMGASAGFRTPVPSPPFCPDCPFSAYGEIDFQDTMIYTVDLDEGVDYEAILTASKGDASLQVENVENLSCNNNVCTFEGTSDMQELHVIGNPGPATYTLKVLLVD